MPTIDEQKAAAMVKVKRNCQIDVEPIVEETEILDMMADYQLAGVWTEATVYVVGDVVIPTTRNGHLYRCVVGGTSALLLVDEPGWPARESSTILDGDSDPVLLWQEAGVDYANNVIDVRGLSYDVWDLKASRATQLYDVSSFKHSQVYDHCVAQRDKFAPLLVA